MGDHVGEVIFNTLVAALATEALLRLWHLDDAETRLQIRLGVIALAVVGSPLLEWLAPFRHAPWFEDRWALFAARRWRGLEVLGYSLMSWWIALWSLASLSIFIVDLLPLWSRRDRRRHLESPALPLPPALAEEITRLCGALGIPTPRTQLLDSEIPVLLCRGVRRPELLISRATLETLEPRELAAALAHELAHLAERDLVMGWLLVGARALQVFNPTLQVIARSIVAEAECRADDRAMAATHDRLSLASALIKVFKARAGGASEHAGTWQTLAYRAHERHIRARCRRLIDRSVSVGVSWRRTRVLAASAMASLLFFLVT